ncbi:MAG: hypothetical protein ACYCPS_02875 [Candidatus Saccharimonadales bacterium]
MLINTKKIIKSYTTSLGLIIMSAATVVGMLELPDHTANRYLLPVQPVRVRLNSQNLNVNPINREREDNTPSYVSYNESQRTPTRSGKY